MIKYALKCRDGHAFEAWFRDSDAFDAMNRAGQVGCAVCGMTEVEKTIMAPAVGKSGADPEPAAPLSTPASPAEQALRKLRDHLRKSSDYVGKEFAEEARRIHDGDAEERAIWGEATREDARALSEDGIPVAPIPWMSHRDD